MINESITQFLKFPFNNLIKVIFTGIVKMASFQFWTPIETLNFQNKKILFEDF